MRGKGPPLDVCVCVLIANDPLARGAKHNSHLGGMSEAHSTWPPAPPPRASRLASRLASRERARSMAISKDEQRASAILSRGELAYASAVAETNKTLV